jgi:Ca2+-binding RTX toxin-like protein
LRNGTKAANTLRGDAQDNIINGSRGSDRLYGEDGNDILIGGTGNDRLNGGNGIDTANYSQATKGIIANLSKGIVLAPIYGTTKKPKIMPLGDSITAGTNHIKPVPGTYRIELWKDFSADGLRVDFVGSQSNGPKSLGDKDHEGHGGWTIEEISALVNGGLLDTYKPDVVLLMIGTNNLWAPTREASAALSDLIDQITEQSPKTQLLVASIAPNAKHANDVKAFNALIPDLVDDKVAQGKKVAFADVGTSLTVKDLVDGTHPNLTGYNKMGDTWYNALVERDTLISIENIVGTDYSDKLVGDAGNNVIEGGDRRDILTGGGGSDTFVFRNLGEGRDTITDFTGDDLFQISAAGFGGGLVADVPLSLTAAATGVFVSGATPAPISNNASFLYDTAKGLLSFDRDGTGSNSALEIAKLNGLPSLSLDQFHIIA